MHAYNPFCPSGNNDEPYSHNITYNTCFSTRQQQQQCIVDKLSEMINEDMHVCVLISVAHLGSYLKVALLPRVETFLFKTRSFARLKKEGGNVDTRSPSPR